MERQYAGLTKYPAKVLSGKAAPVERIDDSIRSLVSFMVETMVANRGIGLAAVQIGVPLQVFVVSLGCSRENYQVYINPEVTCDGELCVCEEGCLSVPGVTEKIRRYSRCKVRATDLSGHDFAQEAEGLLARVCQHESDHLDGITIVERMTEAARIAHRKQLKKLRAAAG